MDVGQKIQEILDWHGMAQKELAQRTDINESTMSRYINGSNDIPSKALVKIASALKVSVYTLINGEPLNAQSIELTKYESSLIGMLRTLSPDQQKFIFQSINLLHENGDCS